MGLLYGEEIFRYSGAVLIVECLNYKRYDFVFNPLLSQG